MRRMLIVTISPERRGGSDIVLETFLRHIDRAAFDVTVAGFGKGPLLDEFEGRGFRVHRLEAGRLRQPMHVARSIRQLASLMRGENPDVILNWLSTAQLYGGPAAIRAGLSKRVVWWQHDLNEGVV